MALNFRRQLNGLQFIPQNTITPTVLGEVRYNSSTNLLELFNGSVDSIVTASSSSALPSVLNNTILSNISGISAFPIGNTLSSIFDSAIASTQGNIIYRNASSWVALSPGTNGQVLASGGVGANPSWISTGGGSGTVTNVATGTGLTGGPITTTGTIALANTTVTAGPYTAANITVDAQGRITAAANGNASAPTGDPNTVAFYNAGGNLADQTTFSWDTAHLGIGQATPKATIHADSSTTSGTVGAATFILGGINSTRNIGAGSLIINGHTGGNVNSAVGTDGFVGGLNNAILSGNSSAILGISNTINNSGSVNFIFGTSGQILGSNGGHFIGGSSCLINTSSGNGTNTAFGISNQITGAAPSGSLISGNSNLITGDLSTCFGLQNTAQGYAQLIAGRNNVLQGNTSSWISTDDLFILGNGVTSGSRSNAFKVTKDGQATVERIVYNPGTTQSLTGNTLITTSSKTLLNVSSTDGLAVSLGNGQTNGQTAIVVNVGTTSFIIATGTNFGGTVFSSGNITLNQNSTASFVWSTVTSGWHTLSTHTNS